MKPIFLFLTLLCSIAAFNQEVKHYFKISPSMISPKDGDVRPAGFAAIGARLSRYTAIGFNVGYFKFEHANKPVIPLGVDLTITDLKTRKISPIIVVSANYPIYDDNTTVRSPLSLESVSASNEGRFMFTVGGGLALPLTQTKKVIATVSFSQLFVKSKIVTKSFVGEVVREASQPDINMMITSLTFLL
jgi:hypothetical protein